MCAVKRASVSALLAEGSSGAVGEAWAIRSVPGAVLGNRTTGSAKLCEDLAVLERSRACHQGVHYNYVVRVTTLRCRIRQILSAQLPGSERTSHSQILTTLQPARRRSFATRRSRALFLSSFFRQ